MFPQLLIYQTVKYGSCGHKIVVGNFAKGKNMIVAKCNPCGGELECEICDKQSQNSLQQLKVEICPYCNGTGLGGRNETGFKLDCWYCHGIGQTTTV
jgi:hypothetical protein